MLLYERLVSRLCPEIIESPGLMSSGGATLLISLRGGEQLWNKISSGCFMGANPPRCIPQSTPLTHLLLWLLLVYRPHHWPSRLRLRPHRQPTLFRLFSSDNWSAAMRTARTRGRTLVKEMSQTGRTNLGRLNTIRFHHVSDFDLSPNETVHL